jgi:phage terminase large subunit
MDEKEFKKKCQEDPVFFSEKVLGVTLWAKQKEILLSIKEHPNTIVVSCNAAGKTFTMAVALLWWLYTKKNSLVVTTAPTFRQIKSVLWAEISRLWHAARIPLGGDMLTTEINVNPKMKWMAMGIPSSEEVRFQGLHAEDILIIFDEAAGIEPHIYTAAAGNLTSQNSRFVLIGNPTSPSGMFYEYSKNSNWNRINISAFDSPAINEPDKYPFLVNQKWIDERRAEWGESSPMYVARVLGRFPEEGEDTLIPLSWLDRAIKRYNEKSGKDLLVSDHIYVGVDVARMGTDKTVACSYQPNKVLPLKKLVGKDLTATTHMVNQECITAGNKLMQVSTDDTGVGGGLTDNLRAQGYPVLGINFSQKAQNRRFFRRLKDEMMWNVREIFRADEIAVPPDDELISQLSSIKYTMDQETGMIAIEAKEDMKDRGLKSPDCAWALALALWGCKRIRTTPSIRRTFGGSEHKREDKSWY